MKHICILIVATLVALSSQFSAHGEIVIDILVPAYAHPCCGGGPNMWNSLISTAGDSNRNFEVHAIFNPASGPGNARDVGYLDANDFGPLADFRNAGGISHGYVATTYGARPVNDVKADIDAYLTGHYAGFVDGIFFDEMSNDLADVGYYQQLHAYVQNQQPGARTFGNPGTTFTTNPSGQSVFDEADYINALDTIMTFESTEAAYANHTSFPYIENLDRLKIAHVVHTQSVWDATVLDTASDRGSGFLYVTDDIFLDPNTDNPYDTLASYWSNFTSDLQIHNAAAAVPTSSSNYLTATIDGDTSEWAGVPVFATDAVDNAGSIDFTSIQIANDENFVYVRYVVNESISSADFNGVYKSVDEDDDVTTGFDIFSLGVIGPEAGWQGDFPFEQATGVFNTGNGLTSAVNLASSLQTSAGTLDVEFAIDRSTFHTVGGANVFPTDGGQIAFALWTDQGAGDVIGGGTYTFAASSQILLGDVNLDGVVNFFDIAPFIGVLTGATFQVEADVDGSGVVDFLDIAPLIAILSGT